MEPASPKRSPGKEDVKPSFCKPSQDAAGRKYRRHTPIGGSDSSASEGSPLHRSRSPVYSNDRQKDDGRELEKNSHHNRLRRGSDTHRQSRVTSHDYARNSEYTRHNRHADDTDRGYQRPSHTDRESRNDTRSDYARHESNTDRSRDSWRSSDRYSRDKSYRGKDNDLRPDDKSASKSWHKDSSCYDIRTGERDTQREKESQGERRDHRRRPPSDHKNGRGSNREELRGHAKNSSLGRDCGSVRSKESLCSDGKESDTRETRRYDDRGSDKRKEKSTKEAEAEMKNDIKSSSGYKEGERNERGSDKHVNASEDQSLPKIRRLGFSEGPLPSKSIANDGDEKASNSKQVESAGKFTSEPASASIPQVELAQGLDAAKVAAMKAAELVNRNLVGGSYMSTDQKKKLLWGNKKSTTTEESGNRWDLQLFPDRERQEKFNKLMGVKIDAIPERKPEKRDGDLRVEKQEQLEMDLEKQYTAGLRRRDGRTVGLGL